MGYVVNRQGRWYAVLGVHPPELLSEAGAESRGSVVRTSCGDQPPLIARSVLQTSVRRRALKKEPRGRGDRRTLQRDPCRLARNTRSRTHRTLGLTRSGWRRFAPNTQRRGLPAVRLAGPPLFG
jgi:hypothetical protein